MKFISTISLVLFFACLVYVGIFFDEKRAEKFASTVIKKEIVAAFKELEENPALRDRLRKTVFSGVYMQDPLFTVVNMGAVRWTLDGIFLNGRVMSPEIGFVCGEIFLRRNKMTWALQAPVVRIKDHKKCLGTASMVFESLDFLKKTGASSFAVDEVRTNQISIEIQDNLPGKGTSFQGYIVSKDIYQYDLWLKKVNFRWLPQKITIEKVPIQIK